MAQELCNTVPNVLLLTATPHRGKPDHFRRILQLLDPDAFAGEGLPDIEELEPYVIRTEKRVAVDYDGKKLFNKRHTHRFDVFLDSQKHQKQIALYDDVTEYVRKGFNTAKKSNNTAIGLIMVLFQRLVSSSTAAILSAMEGRLERLKLGEDADIEAYADEMDYIVEEDNGNISFDDLHQSYPLSLTNEEELLSDLIMQAKDCMKSETDAKTDALLNKIQELQQLHSNNKLKVLIFTEFRTTQRMLYQFFEKNGYKVSQINGSQDIDTRKRSLSYFKSDAQILIGTDAAGESLNMQFCHIVINYDLPWNPMIIEQRIGRVDRIGQKQEVEAFNMLTNNSVDLRVYEVIEEKLNNIIEQLGIDKTSDVLDSTIDMKKVNNLYLQSFLDPERFEFASESWLYDIKKKLNKYKSTEGVLPQVEEAEIDYKKASDIKHSPLPYWLESLIQQYTMINEGSISKNLLGVSEIKIKKDIKRITFDAEVSLNNPGIDHITLQHDWIREILNNYGQFNSEEGGTPIVTSENGEETSGYWSLWEVSAKNSMETKAQYHSFFVADNGKQYAVYANDIWTRLINGTSNFKTEGRENPNNFLKIEATLHDSLFLLYQNLAAELLKSMKIKKENRINSYAFQKSRINKIGIENIRLSKLRKLEESHEDWLKEFKSMQKIIPGTKQLLTIRING
ncbi:MAG: helicase-related protein, partial [Dysgonamonadaceae bacterium]|nr:helicase-related protein [Dysgonamonadaceae bacterium]